MSGCTWLKCGRLDCHTGVTRRGARFGCGSGRAPAGMAVDAAYLPHSARESEMQARAVIEPHRALDTPRDGRDDTPGRAALQEQAGERRENVDDRAQGKRMSEEPSRSE